MGAKTYEADEPVKPASTPEMAPTTHPAAPEPIKVDKVDKVENTAAHTDTITGVGQLVSK